MDKITFLASLPPIQSAIKIGEDMRIQLDIPEQYKQNALPLVMMMGKVLKVTIEEE